MKNPVSIVEWVPKMQGKESKGTEPLVEARTDFEKESLNGRSQRPLPVFPLAMAKCSEEGVSAVLEPRM
jgi:hypothetical protein